MRNGGGHVRRNHMKIRRLSGLAGVLAFTLAALGTARADASDKLRGALPLYFHSRPVADGSRRVVPGAELAPVIIRFASTVTAADLAQLEAAGARVSRRRGGEPRARRQVVFARLPESAIAAVAAMPRVRAITLDAIPFSAPAPLDFTASLVHAPEVWGTLAADNGPLTGRGITVCDVDSGIDVFHPLFFRTDGGARAWIDVDGDGELTPGVDAIDHDGDGAPTTLRVLDSVLEDRYGEVIDGSDDPALRVGWDWLYADLDGSGAREYGRDAGFIEAHPTYGEPLFVVDDVDADGRLDVGEKVIALGSSKIKVAYHGEDPYRRGESLIDFPVDENAAHGTAAMSVMVGGQRGLTRFVGIAPDAELVAVARGESYQPAIYTDQCLDEGARVVLHEYAPWLGYHLDGSSDLEQLIDETSQEAVAHINPAGNLSTSDKMCKRPLTVGGETVIPIEVPADFAKGEFRLLALSLLWSDTSRPLSLTIEAPSGETAPLDVSAGFVYTDFQGKTLYAQREDSSRGTARVDVYLFSESEVGPTIPPGTWKLRVVDPAPVGSAELWVVGAVMDDISSWGKGIHFTEAPTEDHLIGFPGTADHGIGIAAYTGHSKYGGESGTRASYSGRGHRIDGAELLSIAAPDNPITAGHDGQLQARYMEFGGTSGASPHVAGAAALLIEADPTRTGDDVRDAIRAGAVVDDVVGETPNDDWGYGKLDIHRAVYGKDAPGGAPPEIAVAPIEVPIGEPTLVPVEVSDPDEPSSDLRIDLDREYDGTFEERLAGPSFEVTFDELGTWIVRLRVIDSTGNEAGALATIQSVEPPPAVAAPDDDPPALSARGGGCGCSTPDSETSGSAAVMLSALLLAFATARRRRDRG
jgi:MYXO-CTERM domain-containing protein